MKATVQTNRREFLGTASATVALFTGAEGFDGLRSRAAESAATSGHINKEALDKLMAELDAKGRQFLNVPKKDGQFLNLLVKTYRAKSVLEIGTSHGYSAIWISLGREETGGPLSSCCFVQP